MEELGEQGIKVVSTLSDNAKVMKSMVKDLAPEVKSILTCAMRRFPTLFRCLMKRTRKHVCGGQQGG